MTDGTNQDSGDSDTETSGSEQKLPAGICPEHGTIAGDAVQFNFPNPASCSICGSELERAALATEAEIAESTRVTTTTGSERQSDPDRGSVEE